MSTRITPHARAAYHGHTANHRERTPPLSPESLKALAFSGLLGGANRADNLAAFTLWAVAVDTLVVRAPWIGAVYPYDVSRIATYQMQSKNKRRGAHFFWPVLLLTLSGCQYDPYTFSYATEKPQTSEIVGSWTATDETLNELSRTAYSRAHPTMLISADGSIQMREIPDTWRSDLGAEAGKLEDFSGTWQFDKHQNSWWGLALHRGGWGCYGCMMVLGSKPPYRLVIRFGDPDEGRGYEFRKTG